jgi:DNA-binding transcriptional LysR family regulator
MDTLQCMRTFVRVAEAGTFVKAAQNASASSSRTSREIASLENKLQTRLLYRTTRKITVTEIGRRYLEQCRKILSLVDIAEAEAVDVNVRASGRLIVRATTGFGQHYLVPLIAEYRKRFPEVCVDLVLAQGMPDILKEKYDLAIVIAPILPDSSFVSRFIGSISSVLCASPMYLAQHGEPLSDTELENHSCLKLVVPGIVSGVWE